MSNFDNVPIIDVHKKNFTHLWPTLVLAIKTSSFIAIDTELSGLGNRKALQAKSVEDRYKGIAEAAKSRSIISLGLSCFKLRPQSHISGKAWDYVVQTFNITTLCSEDYVVEPLALQFLIDHGFDFNKQYSQGVPYYKGNDKVDCSLEPNLRQLFAEILLSNRILVFHNGIVDLIFLYHCWYASLPPLMATFLADINEAFPAGIYDTKYVAEYVHHSSASYLEYVFRKLQRENIQRMCKNQSYVGVHFLDYSPHIPFVEYKKLGIDTTGLRTVSSSQICMTYANHGWCPNGFACSLSHNIDCILDMEITPSKKRRWILSKNNGRDETPNKKRNSTEVLNFVPALSESSSDLTSVSSSVLPKIEQDITLVKDSVSLDSININRGVGCPLIVSSASSLSRLKTQNPAQPNMMDGDCNGSSLVPSDRKLPPLANAKKSNEAAAVDSMQGDADSIPSCDYVTAHRLSKDELNGEKSVPASDPRLERKFSCHRAGCDAFMTGFSMATFLSRYGKFPGDPCLFSPLHTHTEEMVNKIYLSGKDVPLLIQKSVYTKSSKPHQEKLLKLQRILLANAS